MNNILIKWIAVLAVVVSQNVWAALEITDVVVVGGQEWAQVDLFTSNSWNTINAECPSGICLSTGEINGWDLDGWTWASSDEVQTLFNTFTGQVNTAPFNYTEIDSAWAPIFTSIFNPTQTTSSVVRVFGWSSTQHSVNYGWSPVVNDLLANGSTDEANTDAFYAKGTVEARRGAWFVRDVPAPATLSLFGLGLASMWISRRKKHAAKV